MIEGYVNYPERDRRYRHYKGGIYTVLFMSNHSETSEVLVNYQSHLFGSYHSRPLDSWNEVVNTKSGRMTRFKPC